MPRNGSGTFTLYPGVNPVVTGTTITSSWANNTLSDIQSALTASIANDGQTPITADLPMTGFKHTNVGNAAARNSYAAAGQVQDSTFTWGGTAGGTSDALTLTLTPAITAYAAGQVFRFLSGASANTTTTPTLNVSGLGAVTLKRADGTALAIGDIKAGTRYEAEHDGTNFRLRALIASPALGGTGVNNGTFTITLGGNISTAGAFTTSGANSLTLTTTGATNVTLPTSGTLVNDAVTTLSSLASIGTITTGTWNGTIITSAYGGTGNGFTKFSGPATAEKTFTLPNASATILTDNAVVTGAQGGTGVANTGKTITLGGNLTTSGAFASTFTMTNTTSVTFPTSGTLLSTAAAVTAAQGGTGQTSLTLNNVILGNGTSAVQFVAPGTSGNVLTSNGTTWASSAPPAANGIAVGATSTNPTAAGTSATGLGHKAAAGSNYSTAIGSTSGNTGSTTATGAGAVAINGYASGVDSFAAAIANNTSTYGATAANAVAMGQTSAASATGAVAIGVSNTASGTYSAVLGVTSTASGNNSYAFGVDLTASGQYSMAFGYKATAAQVGKHAFASGYLSAQADAQQGVMVLKGSTTTNSSVVLTSGPNLGNNTASSSNQLIVASGQAMAFTGTLIGKQASSANIAAYTITGTLVNNGGTVTMPTGTLTIIGTDSIGLGTAPSLAADNTNKGLTVNSGNKSATTINWVCTLYSSEITG
jgi:hypothetical protein